MLLIFLSILSILILAFIGFFTNFLFTMGSKIVLDVTLQRNAVFQGQTSDFDAILGFNLYGKNKSKGRHLYTNKQICYMLQTIITQ